MKTPDERFLLREVTGGSDHWMDLETKWLVQDTVTNKTILRFSGRANIETDIQDVELDESGWIVIATDRNGEIVEQVDLREYE